MAVLGGVLAVTLLRPAADPVLLDPRDFTGVEAVHQGKPSQEPGWTWCNLDIAPWTSEGDPVTTLDLDHDTLATAVIADGRPDATAEEIVSTLSADASACAESESVTLGASIEPLTGLDDGEVGWRTTTTFGAWGEYVLVPLDDSRVLAVGFATWDDDPAVAINELVARAKAGAEQFPAHAGA
ncbi:MAG TPA: hypothetical protein VGC37_13270 [Friedmanniella sp.]